MTWIRFFVTLVLVVGVRGIFGSRSLPGDTMLGIAGITLVLTTGFVFLKILTQELIKNSQEAI